MAASSTVLKLYESIGEDPGVALCEGVAHVEVHHNKVVGADLVPGLQVDAKEHEDGIEATIVVERGVHIKKPIRMCFGMLPETGLQRIILHVKAEAGSQSSIVAHCTFPNAVNVRHLMDADIDIGEGAVYSYFERHVHGPKGGVVVVPKAKVTLGRGARFKTEFELIKGGVGSIDIDYDTTADAHSVLEMIARISGRNDDRIAINERARLMGEGARGVLQTFIALRDDAQARVANTLIAEAPYAQGHVDCKEIVQDRAMAAAVPIVEVKHPKARVTHEASIGSVDNKQLETLMARGLTEDEAVEVIIAGLLS